MKRVLPFRLGRHKLPTATDRCTGVARACRLCTFRDAGAIEDKRHLVLECAGVIPLWAKYADLFNDNDYTMHSFLAQQDHLRVFHYVTECLNLMDRQSLPLCGTCNQPCWLTPACKVLLLLLHPKLVLILRKGGRKGAGGRRWHTVAAFTVSTPRTWTLVVGLTLPQPKDGACTSAVAMLADSRTTKKRFWESASAYHQPAAMIDRTYEINKCKSSSSISR